MRLETSRLVLRSWKESDIDDLIDGLNNFEVSKWLVQVPYPYTLENAKNYIEFCNKNELAENKSSYQFAIELKTEKRVIGGTSLERINLFHGTASGGIWINSKYHGSGYGTEAFGRRIEFAFTELNLRRLENGYLDGNQASHKMQEKLGYVIEGKRRKGFKCMADGQLKDEFITGLLKEDWENAVRRL